MNKMFSVIIPCYNAASFLDRSLQSVVGQSLDKSMFEIIAVNDASTDETLNCLNKWAEEYPTIIKVLTNEINLRQGGARNVAIKHACGEYVCFLDADDWMETDALATFMIGIQKGDMDIVTSKHQENYEDSDISITSSNEDRGIPKIEKEFNDSDKAEFIAYNLGFVWCSVYKRSMITENEIWFPEHLAYEDICWQRLIKFYARKACIIDRITHHHFNHSESTMNKKNATHHIDRLKCYEILLEEYNNRGLLKPYYSQIMNDTMETYLYNSYYMFFTMMDYIPDVYERMRSTIYNYFPDWETTYDDSMVPMVFQYLIKYLKKAKKATPEDLQPFKDAILEIVKD